MNYTKRDFGLIIMQISQETQALIKQCTILLGEDKQQIITLINENREEVTDMDEIKAVKSYYWVSGKIMSFLGSYCHFK